MSTVELAADPVADRRGGDRSRAALGVRELLREGGFEMGTSPAPRRGEQTGTPLLPLAIAVLGAGGGATEDQRRTSRLALALAAYEMGYFVLDIVEVSSDGTSSGYRWVAALAQRTDAEALVIAGEVDRELLDAVADRNRMVVRPI